MALPSRAAVEPEHALDDSALEFGGRGGRRARFVERHYYAPGAGRNPASFQRLPEAPTVEPASPNQTKLATRQTGRRITAAHLEIRPKIPV